MGGKGSSQRVNLQHSLVQLAGTAQHLGRPRTHTLVQNMNTVLNSAARVPGPLYQLQHQLGICHRLAGFIEYMGQIYQDGKYS